MIKAVINGLKVEVPEGTTILEAAKRFRPGSRRFVSIRTPIFTPRRRVVFAL